MRVVLLVAISINFCVVRVRKLFFVSNKLFNLFMKKSPPLHIDLVISKSNANQQQLILAVREKITQITLIFKENGNQQVDYFKEDSD